MSADAPVGLVLAGGRGRRMGSDKGALEYRGGPQVRRAVELLQTVLEHVLVAIREDQADSAVYRGLEVVFDEPTTSGPAAGLLAAALSRPATALLAVAVDLPLLNRALLDELLAQRDTARFATVFRHPDGTLEPLCAIWEPVALARLAADCTDAGVSVGPSLRRLLEQTDVKCIEPAEPERLASVNTPEEFARAKALLDR